MIAFCGLELEHELINGSGTFDAIAAERVFGEALLEAFPFSAFVSKTITLEPRDGNPPPRLFETPGGMINSIGLPNRGVAGYLEHDLPHLARLPVPLITNVMGSTVAQVIELVEAIGRCDEVAAIELNVSCPNVSTGLDIGASPQELARLVTEVRPRTAKPLIVKLTPNTADVAGVAQAAEDSGADAVSLINTLRAYAPHPATAREALARRRDRRALGSGGARGRACAGRGRRAAGGAPDRRHGRGHMRSACPSDLLDAGARLVAVGTENFRDPLAARRVRSELAELAANSGILRRLNSQRTSQATKTAGNRRETVKHGEERWTSDGGPCELGADLAFAHRANLYARRPVPSRHRHRRTPSTGSTRAVAPPEDGRAPARQRDPHPAGAAQARPEGRCGTIDRLLLEPPEFLETAKVVDCCWRCRSTDA